MKKALLFDPYMDTLGGGERYVLSFALGLIKNGYSVTLAWNSDKELREAEKRFGLDFSKIMVDSAAYDLCSQKSAYAERLNFTKDYDLIFWVSDGSLPFLFSKNNLIHLQVPFKKFGSNAVINNLKTVFVKKFVYNSNFTKEVLEKQLPASKGFVLYPPIDIDKLSSGEKENVILSVGRFDSPSHSKRQDVLVEAFKILSKKNKDFKLVLAGGLVGDETLMNKIKASAEGLNIEFVINPDFTELKSMYSKSKFYWHAAGYEVDEMKDPEKVEHFGMTTVEAMASGAVPIVISKGGQKEIVTPETGFLCETPEEIADKTLLLISDQVKLTEMSKTCLNRSKVFSIDNFYEKIKVLL